MTRAIAEADALATARAVMNARDAKGFTKIADALGIALELGTYVGYVQKHAKSPYADFTNPCGAAGLQLLFTALTSEHGHAMAVECGQTILVAKSNDKVLFAMQDGSDSQPFKKWGWKITPRWYKDPARNRPTIENWLADPLRERDAMSIPITRMFVPSQPDDRGAALLAAVCADPDDVAARLVYADWLVEQGDMRGELIRVQCDRIGATGERAKRLEDRATELVTAYRTTMIEPIKRFVNRAAIERGLIEDIQIDGDQLIKHGAKLVAEHPITKLHVLVKNADQFAKLATMPWIGNIAHVKYEGRSEKRVINSGATLGVTSAIGTAMFAKTKQLLFEYVDDTPKQWAKFYAGISAPMLETLSTSDLDAAGITALARSKGLPKLRDLTLGGLEASARTPKVLAQLATRSLVSVSLVYIGKVTKLGASVAAIVTPTVRNLYLNGLVGGGLARALADRGAHLEDLTLDRVAITLDEVAELLATRKLPNLARLAVSDLDGNAEAFTAAVCAAPKRLASIEWRRTTKELAQRIKASGRAVTYWT